MKIILNNDNGYNADIQITDADKEKNSEDILYDILSLIATLVGQIQSEVFDFSSIEEEKKSAYFMLDAVKDMLTSYYGDVEKSMKKQHEGKKIYGYMNELYEEYLKKNNWEDSDVFEMLDGRSTDMDTILDGEELRFSIVDKKSGEELIVLNKVPISKANKNMEEPIHEAVEANAVAIILYDKLFGDNEEENPARAKGGLWFNEQAKKFVENM